MRTCKSHLLIIVVVMKKLNLLNQIRVTNYLYVFNFSFHFQCFHFTEKILSFAEGNKRVVCIAHRVVSSDNSNNTDLSPPVEQFTTRLLFNGKILSVDTSGVSATYSQYLNKDLVGLSIHSLCHPSDRQIFDQHWNNGLFFKMYLNTLYTFKIHFKKHFKIHFFVLLFM